MRIACVVAVAVLASCSKAAAWDPATTRVFAAGVLNFEDKHLAAWPDDGRVDAVMIDEFKRRGVPEDHIAFVTNEKATRQAAEARLVDLLATSSPGETLVFYY